MNFKMLGVALAALGLMAATGGRSAAPGASTPGRLTWPLAQWVETQPFGCTSFAMEPAASWCPGGHFHSGIDMAAPAGTAVHAAAAGRAVVSWSTDGYGLHVVLDHGGGTATLYGHLESTPLSSGDLVAAGAEIGLVGSTGMSTGPHLHFEVRHDGRPVDPTSQLPPRS